MADKNALMWIFSFLILWGLTTALMFTIIDVPSEIIIGEGTDLLSWLLFLAGVLLVIVTFLLSFLILFSLQVFVFEKQDALNVELLL